MSDNSIIRSSAIMAAGTFVSRVTGLIRGLLLVAVLGTTLLGDTYNVANTMPNILYNLIIGGALAAVFVPQMVRAIREPDGGSAFISRLVTATSVVLGLLVLISIFAAPLLVRIFAGSYVGRPEFHLTVLFMRYCLPQIFFMGLFALLGQVANAKGKFGPMMWAPVFNNLVVIGVFGYYLHLSKNWKVSSISNGQATWLAVGTTAGYVIQLACLIPVLKQTNIKMRPRFDWRDPEIKKSLHLATWTLAFAAFSQLSYLVTLNLSTSAAVRALKEGITTGVGYTPYGNAFLIFFLPHSVITISIVTAILPLLSTHAIDKKFKEIHDELVRAIRLVGIITVPSAIAFLLFGPLITRTLFFGISNADARYLGLVLSAFALGLLPLSVNLIALRGINAFENVKLQVLSNAIMNIVASLIALIFALTLPARWVTVGLAAALALSYYVGAWTSIRLLRRYNIVIRSGEITSFYLRLALIYSAVAIPLYLVMGKIPGGNTLKLLVVLSVSGLGYLGIAKTFKIAEVGAAFAVFLRRGRSKI
jgi:putative peptidoglycan lipid II flippase